MLFNSYEFLFVFLPAVLAVYFLAGHRLGKRPALAWLVVASLVYYGWWNVSYLALIAVSITVNYIIGRRLASEVQATPAGRRAIFLFGIIFNLGMLGYFKYANFFVTNVEWLSGHSLEWTKVLLPIGISFMTFQKIAFLVDTYRGKAPPYRFLDFCLFVTFFPQLIAGPIVHHGEILPQFARTDPAKLSTGWFAAGFTVFAIGLFKKVVIADSVAEFVAPVFDAAASGVALSLFEAWTGALTYTFQIYFDFSGYSDMAIGLACLFGIRLPINFNSPYKATSIIDFWRRWHMTLSRFLRDYVYFPLGGNRRGPRRRHANLMATMILGGFWHGAGWTFVLWGGMHGAYLIFNHGWRSLRGTRKATRLERAGARILTFLAVVVAWVMFRAETVDAALGLYKAMAGANGVALRPHYLPLLGPLGPVLAAHGVAFGSDELLMVGIKSGIGLLAVAGLAWFAPNTQQIMHRYAPTFEAGVEGAPAPRPRLLAWEPTAPWAFAVAGLAVIALLFSNRVTEFLYYQF